MRALFHECQLPRELPDLDSCGLFSVSELHGATYNPALRKMVLRSYRHDVVKPLLLDLDRQHLMESIIEPFPTFGFSLADLGFYEVRLEWEMFDHASVPRLLISISGHGVLCGSRADGRYLFWAKLNSLSTSRALPVVEKMFQCCTCWEDAPPRNTSTGTFGLRVPPEVRGGNFCSISSEIPAHGRPRKNL